MNLISKISPQNRILNHARLIAEEVLKKEDEYTHFSDQELINKSDDIIEYLANNNPLDDRLVESLCIIREVIYRVHNKRAFKVQLIGAIIVYFGDFAEMMTGEGKTFSCLLKCPL